MKNSTTLIVIPLTIIASSIAVIDIAVLFSCTTLDKAIDSIEQPHDALYNHTKAVFVVKRQGKNLYCVSATGTRYYKIRDRFGWVNSDTIILRENKWVYDEISFIKHLPE